MNKLIYIQNKTRNFILASVVLTSALSFSSAASAGVEASISLLPQAQNQTEFLTNAETLLDESLFKRHLVAAANKIVSDVSTNNQSKLLTETTSGQNQWQPNRVKRHLYGSPSTRDSIWQFLSVSLHQGDIELTMGNKYPKH